MQQNPSIRCRQGGVLAMETTRIDHDGTLLKDIGYFGDHGEQHHKITHDRFRNREQYAPVQRLY